MFRILALTLSMVSEATTSRTTCRSGSRSRMQWRSSGGTWGPHSSQGGAEKEEKLPGEVTGQVMARQKLLKTCRPDLKVRKMLKIGSRRNPKSPRRSRAEKTSPKVIFMSGGGILNENCERHQKLVPKLSRELNKCYENYLWCCSRNPKSVLTNGKKPVGNSKTNSLKQKITQTGT